MAFDFNTLEPHIRSILSAPGIDLETITAKRVRYQLPDLNHSLTLEFLKRNKKDIDAVIARVYEEVSAGSVEETEVVRRKRKQDEAGDERQEDKEGKKGREPPPKKAKKAVRTKLSDAELARKLSDEINSRSRRTTSKARGSSNGAAKKTGRAKKSSATVDSGDDSNEEENGKQKKRSTRGGSAKGGFAKEYSLSEPLAALLNVDKLSRPQVVKQLWIYIKGHGLQNPENKKEILCDGSFKAVFGVDKIGMFRMNKVLGQHLHESEG